MIMSENNLKPCPFCGGEAEKLQMPINEEIDGSGKDIIYYIAGCMKADCLGCHGTYLETQEEADRLWNTRSNIDFAKARSIYKPESPFQREDDNTLVYTLRDVMFKGKKRLENDVYIAISQQGRERNKNHKAIMAEIAETIIQALNKRYFG
jgi:hypothetical protein